MKDVPRNLSLFNLVHMFGWIGGRDIASHITTGISSYNHEVRHWQMAQQKLPRFRAIAAASRDLCDRLKEQKLNNNIYCTPNGVDHTLFYPKNNKRGMFTIGWVGQPTGGLLGLNINGPSDQHGYEHVLTPLKERLKEYPSMRFISVERNYTNALPHDQLNSFYNECDCVIHPGYLTGTPNPIFEAAACGCAVLCTRIGAAQDMIQDGINGYLIDSYKDEEGAKRTIEAFMKKILFLKDNRDLCNEMGKKSREIIEKDWTWEKRAQAYLPVFEKHRVR